MRSLQAVLVGLAVLMVALSGCTSADEPAQPASVDQKTTEVTTDDPDGVSSKDGGDGGDAGQDGTDPNGTAEDVANTLPQATLDADNLTGEAPMDVTFTIDASDDDGDELTWTLDVDGDQVPDAEGDELPTTYTHTYAEGFTGNASLVVSDGTEEVATAIALDIADAPAPETFSFECTVPVPSVGVSMTGTIGACELGTLEKDSTFTAVEEPGGCRVTYREESVGGTGSLVDATVGETYPAGTEFQGACGAGALPESTVVAHFEVVA